MVGIDTGIDNGYTYFQEFKPVGHVGYSIWLYELSEEDILGSKSWAEVYRFYLGHGTAVHDESK